VPETVLNLVTSQELNLWCW